MEQEKLNKKTLDVAKLFANMLKYDWATFCVVDGLRGSGKSCIIYQIIKDYCKIMKLPFKPLEIITYKREELLKWIDGDANGVGQKPEYSVIWSDELISMFFNRNFNEPEQKQGIELLNKCRDRHLLMIGAIPVFWRLDAAIRDLTDIRISLQKRGLAYMFMQEPNPFVKDKWNQSKNASLWEKYKNPYKIPNLLAQLTWQDWTPEERIEYKAFRDEKRKGTENQGKTQETDSKIPPLVKAIRGEKIGTKV